MSYIAVEDVKQGMVVDQDVRDINNRLLLSKGQEIKDKHLRILKIWGVAQISVAAANAGDPAEEQPMDVEKATRVKAALDFLFQRLDGANDTIKDTYRLAFLHRYQSDGTIKSHEKDKRFKGACLSETYPDIREKIQRIDIKLPEAPEVITRLNAVIADPFATSNDIAQVVEKSSSLAALLLKLVNSAFYGFPAKIDRISRAVTIIGSKEISNLALGLCVMKTFDSVSTDVVDLSSFMKHSFTCGLISRIMGARLNMKQTEQLFVAGLLHDIGKLVVYKYFPRAAAACFNFAASSSDSVYQAENKVLGLHHTQISKYLLKKWQLPFDLEDIIIHHHAPRQAVDQGKAGLVQMADIIVNALGVGSSGEWILPDFDMDCWAELGLANATLATIMRQALHQLKSIETILNYA